jgi:hypothetical protein
MSKIKSTQFRIHSSPHLDAAAMDVAVAISAERDQIFVCVVTQLASRANVMNLETIGLPQYWHRQKIHHARHEYGDHDNRRHEQHLALRVTGSRERPAKAGDATGQSAESVIRFSSVSSPSRLREQVWT